MKKVAFICLVVILLFLLPVTIFAQKNKEGKFIFKGFVYGYSFESTKKLFKKNTQYIKDDNLQDFKTVVKLNNEEVFNKTTSANGEFEIKLSYGKKYTVEFSKPTFKNTIIEIDLTTIPTEVFFTNINFSNVQISLCSIIDFENNTEHEGKLFFNNEQNYIDFDVLVKTKGEIYSKHNPYNILQHLKNAVQDNKEDIIATVQKSKEANSIAKETNNKESEIGTTKSTERLQIKSKDIKQREKEIEAALKQLEEDKKNAVTPEELEKIAERELQLNQAVEELKESKKMIETQKNEISTQKTLLLLSSLSLVLLCAFLYVLYKNNKNQRKANVLLNEQKKEIEQRKQEIIDSINYAQRIQHSLLASTELLNNNLKEYFIFFKPKDIVSGDFYWAAKLSNGNFAMATADSTGHGVPGAIMSMLNISCLNEAVSKNITEPDKLLHQTRQTIIATLKNDGSESGGKDGMDCSLLSFSSPEPNGTVKLQIACANNSVWIVTKANSGKQAVLTEIKADKLPVGKHNRDKDPFTLHNIELQKGDIVYTLTDGFPDQFGGENKKKFMRKKLKELLLENAYKPLAEQKEILETTFNAWKGDLAQIDDVTVIGVRI